MKALISLIMLLLCTQIGIAQVGTIKTEQYQAEFEKKQSIDALPEYTDTFKIPIQILKIGINEELYEMYPELKDKRVGLGVTNIVLEYLEYTNRFVFTEDKLEIKERMIQQFKASDKGFTENKVDGRGKIKLAKYFVYIEVYDFSVSDDEILKINGEAKTTQITRLGLQVKFVDAETGEILTGSGLGEANTIKTVSILDGVDDSEIKFNQSTIGTTTKK
jgi:curli biogenesis system outer membrane secretion channel CsgG